MSRLVALAWSIALLALPLGAEATIIRIAVAEGASEVRAQAEGLRIRPLTDEGYYDPIPSGSIRLTPGGDGVQWADGSAPTVKLRADGPISIAGKVLRGAVEILPDAKGLLVVNELEMEKYLAAVLGSEMPPSFEPEALKAQAVAARTYAVGKKIAAQGQPWHLGATVLAQVYGGVHREDPRTHAAVAATSGMVLVFDHVPAEAYFFSSCGGRTEVGAEALGRPLPYLRSVDCPEHRDTPGASWSLRLSAQELGRKLGLGAVRSLEIDTRTPSGRARTLAARTAQGTQRVTAVELRRKLGYSSLKSLSFSIERTGGDFVFRGRGQGHAAGMCQWGAQAAAKDGWSWQAILEHYYPGAELRRMY